MILSKAIEGFFLVKRSDGFSEETIKIYTWAYNIML